MKDYDLEVWREGGWEGLLAVRDNYHRRRDHEFAAVTTTSPRLRVLATHGEGFGARVYAIAVM